MALSEVPCLIGQAACRRLAGNPVCPKCGMDERVVYPGQVDREAAQAAALARYEAVLDTVKPPPLPEPPISATLPEPQAQPPQQPEPATLGTSSLDKEWIQPLGMVVLALAMAGGAGWWSAEQDERRIQVARQGAQEIVAEEQASFLQDRYQIVANGSDVKDMQTGLVWARCSLGQRWDGSRCAGEDRTFTFHQVQKLAVNGWRVPTVRELASLVYCSSGQKKRSTDLHDGGSPIANVCDGQYTQPTIRLDVFPDSSVLHYWTSSPFPLGAKAWVVFFANGHVTLADAFSSYRVRLVRAHQ